MNFRHQSFCVNVAMLCAAAFAVPAATAQTVIERPIRLVVGFPAGTGPDVLARFVGNRLSEQLKQPVVVDNKPGAGAQIATQVVAKSPADGSTLLLGEVGSVSIAPAAFSKLTYDPSRELTGVAELAWSEFVLVVGANSPHKSFASLVNDARAKAVPMNFATFGAGSPGHFAAVEFGVAAAFPVQIIHYRSTGDAITGIISGDVAGAWVSTALASAQVTGGRLRALATTAKTRSPILPDVPTTAEAGMPQLATAGWLGVLAPSGTPSAILDALSSSFVQAVNTPDVKARLTEAGFTVTGAHRTEMNRMLRTEAQRWAGTVSAAGFKGD